MYQHHIAQFPYQIQPGDNISLLAERCNTTVEAIVSINPMINQYPLNVGQFIYLPIVPFLQPIAGNNYGTSPYVQRKTKCVSMTEVDLKSLMRRLWQEHIAWTRMAIISITFNLPGLDVVITRLLQNATDMGNAFKVYYGDQIAAKVSSLIKEHLVIAADLVKAAKAGDNKSAENAEKLGFKNADEIAHFINNINPYWPYNSMRKMWFDHLRLTKSEAFFMLTKDYKADISTFDKIEKQALEMADEFTNGVVRQFPTLFTC